MTTEALEIEVLDTEKVAMDLCKVEASTGLADDTAVALRGEFNEYYTTIESLRAKAAQITNPEDPEQQAAARGIRLGLKNVRCDVERVRKNLKADSLSRGKAIDGFSNILKYLCEPVESALLDVERYAEIQEEKRVAEMVRERIMLLVEVEGNAEEFNLAEMKEDTFVLVLAGAKKQRDNRIEAERKTEADRIKAAKEEAEEHERVAAENEKLKNEAATREKKAAAERKIVDAEKKAAKAAADKKESELEKKAMAERDARMKAERESADALAREKKIKDEAKAKEAARIAEEEAIAKKAAAAPDRDKLIALSWQMRVVVWPEMTTDEGKKVLAAMENGHQKFVEEVVRMAEEL